MKNIVSFGSINFDYVYTLPRIVQPGETISSTSMAVFLGGKGFNQAAALKKAGAEVWLAGQIGEDGASVLDACSSLGIRSEHVRTVPGKTGHAIIQVDANAENSILLYGGANQAITREHIDQVLAQFGPGDYLLLQNEINLLPYLVDAAYGKSMNIILNPSPYSRQVDACDLSKVSWFLINQVEGRQITSADTADAILCEMQRRFPKAGVLLTLGGSGAWCSLEGTRLYQPAMPADAVDTTAAGDTFTGFFIASLCAERPLEDALALSAAAAAICVSRAGALSSIPTLSEVRSSGLLHPNASI